MKKFYDIKERGIYIQPKKVNLPDHLQKFANMFKNTGFITLLFLLFAGTGYANYVSKTNVTGTYENQSSWIASGYGSAYPAANGNVDKEMTIATGAVITRTGNLNPVTVNVNGTFNVYGDYTNNQWSGLIINSGGKVEIFGNLTGSAAVTVKSGGTLIVHGNFSSTGSSVSIQGNMIVLGNYSTSSGTTLNVNGNLVVGGNFTHSGGSLSGTSDKNLYIINPDAVITNPGWGAIKTGNYGVLDDFVNNESTNTVLITIVENFGLVPYTWVGTENTDWFNTKNWNRKAVPSSASHIVINTGSNFPVINAGSVAQTGSLTIKSGSRLTVNPGGKLTVNGDLVIEQEEGLVIENSVGANGMASIIGTGTVSGSAGIKLTLPKDQWYYISSAIRTATYGNFNPEATGAKVYVFRGNKWVLSTADQTSNPMQNLEGALVKYVPDTNPTYTINYKGTLNTGSIERTITTPGWYLFGNPYPSFINWQNDAGWGRPNIDGTIWYRTKIGNVMTFITYNRLAPTGARVALYPPGSTGTEAEMGLIPPMQAVWIKVLAPTTISVNNNMRSHGVAGSQLKSASTNSTADVIRITTSNSQSQDGAVIYFDENATEGIDAGDSEKRLNDSQIVPEVYSRVGNTSLAINGLLALGTENRSIPISVRNRNEENVVLTFDLSLFNAGHTVTLEDRETGEMVNLRVDKSYIYTPLRLGDVHDRFVIHLNFVTTSVVTPKEPEITNNETSGIKITGVSGRAIVSVSTDLLETSNALIEIYSIDGQKINETNASSSETLIMLPRVNSVFIIKVTVGQLVKTEKIKGRG